MRRPLLFVLALLCALTVQAAPPAGWSTGPAAANTAAALAPGTPVSLLIPAPLAAQVQGPTAFFYFSPTCPHCQHAMPEVNALAALPGLRWVGIAVGGTDPTVLADFARRFGATFPLVVDETRGFARAVGARSTPSVYLLRPSPPGATPPNVALLDDGAPVEIFEAFAPFSRGAGGLLRLRLHPAEPFADFAPGVYQGMRTCMACHTEEARSWALTHHSVAWRTLWSRQRTEDAACVPCHVTGYGAPGGFVPGDLTSPLVDVTCESCHGPGGPHAGVAHPPATDSCVGCHNKEHSVAFTVEKGLPFIDHWMAAGLPDADLEARVRALSTGEAPRPLLAFPDGPTVGDAACASCHAAAAAAHPKGPHGDTLASLSRPARKDPACLTCHASPTVHQAMRSAAPTASDFRPGGVGCESCHGPGGAHVAAPSAENIVGLGKSCPECVIEGICTSCHTPQWDPGWSLGPRLDAVRATHGAAAPAGR